jgi:ferrochelatase
MPKGVLLVNLGTPGSPSIKAVRRYLDEFLMDSRVIDVNPIFRALLVKGIIVPFRSPKSAKLYRQIWNDKTGSPLLHYSNIQRQLLKLELGKDYCVELAMRYQYPSIDLALEKLRNQGVESILVIPMFPQYASATNGSVCEKVMEIVSKWSAIPSMSFINSFHDNELMIDAFVENGIRCHPETSDHILFSFHGLPQRQLAKCDVSGKHCCKAQGCANSINKTNRFCYFVQCHHTARLIAQRLSIPKEKFTVCFQSRLGKQEWLKPYASAIIKKLAQEGKKSILVFSPAFVADCLETLYEIKVEYEQEFKAAGGEHLQLVQSLNDSPKFIHALKQMVIGN